MTVESKLSQAGFEIISNEISITNPLYFEKAYLQKKYDETEAKKFLLNLTLLFPDSIIHSLK